MWFQLAVVWDAIPFRSIPETSVTVGSQDPCDESELILGGGQIEEVADYRRDRAIPSAKSRSWPLLSPRAALNR